MIQNFYLTETTLKNTYCCNVHSKTLTVKYSHRITQISEISWFSDFSRRMLSKQCLKTRQLCFSELHLETE